MANPATERPVDVLPTFAEGRFSDRQVSRHEVCATCGMTLMLPGVQRDGQRYCCHGCVPQPEQAGGALHSPEPQRSVGAVRAVSISAKPEDASAFLADIKLLALYEQKLARIQLTGVGQDGKTACATADGQFGAFPYHIELHFYAVEGGYRSTLCSGGPIVGLRGTFVARPAEGGCVVTHSEQYELRGGWLGTWLGRLLQPYIGWSMERELRTLKRLIEEPAALGEALRKRDPRQIEVDPSVPVWDPRREGSERRGLTARAPTPELVTLLTGIGLGALLAGGVFVGVRALSR